MTTEHLANILRKRYEQAEKSEVVLAIHLFGIEFAGGLEGHSANDIAEMGTGHRSYGTEVRKGIRLAAHVELKKG